MMMGMGAAGGVAGGGAGGVAGVGLEDGDDSKYMSISAQDPNLKNVGNANITL